MPALDNTSFGAPSSSVDPVVATRRVPAAAHDVFAAFTSGPAVSEWLGVPATIDLEVGGRFELLFDTEQEPGLQGSEGCQILAFTPDRMLAFTWNSPPSLPDLRDSLTSVVIHLSESGGGTDVELIHSGHGTGERWDENRRYFERAWGLVLDRLVEHFTG